jgi:phosphoglycolate phosphatase
LRDTQDVRPRAILFDFDYTLADSSEAIIDCFNTSLTAMGLAAADPDVIRSTIGLSLEESLAQVVGERFRSRSAEFRSHWRLRSDRIMVELTRLLPGAEETVRTLVSQGFDLAVVSTKYRCRIEETFEKSRLRESFRTVVGGDDVNRHKPHPEGLLLALNRLGVRAADALFVGDSAADAEAAGRAGVPFVGVLSGVTSAQVLAKWNCVQIASSVRELPALLKAMPGQARSF